MSEFVFYILTALAMIFVIEGLAYAFFPDAMRKMMGSVLAMPVSALRLAGFVAASFGAILIWLLKFFS
jgi:uncharacterized protein YjeT (DUF2065 family)